MVLPSGAERHSPDLVGVAGQRLANRCAGGGVPPPHRATSAGKGDHPAVRMNATPTTGIPTTLPLGDDQQDPLNALRRLPVLDLLTHPFRLRRFRRGEHHEMLRLVERSGDLRPQRGRDRQPAVVTKDAQGTPSVPGPRQPLEAALDSRSQQAIRSVAVGDERRIASRLTDRALSSSQSRPCLHSLTPPNGVVARTRRDERHSECSREIARSASRTNAAHVSSVCCQGINARMEASSFAATE